MFLWRESLINETGEGDDQFTHRSCILCLNTMPRRVSEDGELCVFVFVLREDVLTEQFSSHIPALWYVLSIIIFVQSLSWVQVGSLELGLQVRVDVCPWSHQSWMDEERGRLLLKVWSGTCPHQSTTEPLYLDRGLFSASASKFSMKVCDIQALSSNGDMWPPDYYIFFLSSLYPLSFHSPRPPPLCCSCCSSENIVSHGMSKHAWPSFLWTCMEGLPPSPHSPHLLLCKAHQTSQPPLSVTGETTNLEVGFLWPLKGILMALSSRYRNIWWSRVILSLWSQEQLLE